ncbi:hypothetical protein J2X46_000436 [Nocardioides sp. BE266]|uniref:hypothetical protein n=1 Tax=Nocardioides sp. BE266 TaxID=2817725 RepID=UPI0028646C13|nr:hypothetical protein [Nocardioides sp. BE266]MDR7251464.1 hypothetical protein [Nocardioides sp. BE266]
MPLFGRRDDGYDTRSRDLVVSAEPVVTADSFIVLVDLVVRWDHVPEEEGPGLDWTPTDEVAIEAVAIATLRVEGEKATRDELVAERTRLADPVTKALSFAPVAAGFRSTLVSLEVRPHEDGARRTSEFRVVG